jgi:hypothetical protein
MVALVTEIPAEPLAGVVLFTGDRLEQGEPAGVRQGLGNAVELTTHEEFGVCCHSLIVIELSLRRQEAGRPSTRRRQMKPAGPRVNHAA